MSSVQILYLEHHAWFPQWILLGLIFQYVLSSLWVSSHVTLELWQAAVAWWVGAAARKQLLLPATVLRSGCLKLLLPQTLSWESTARHVTLWIKNLYLILCFTFHITDQLIRRDTDLTSVDGWTNTTGQTNTDHSSFTADITEVPPRLNLLSSVVWECFTQ